MEQTLSRHQMTRHRLEPMRRLLTVAGIEELTPKMRRIRFASPDLHDFVSLSPDDHVRLFAPLASDSDEVCARDYTPRAFDAVAGELTIDFATHEAGPATLWALRAKVGDQVKIGGPRGSMVAPDDFDFYLLVGDETALPSIGRRLETLRPGVVVATAVIVDDPKEIQSFTTRANWTPLWIFRAAGGASDAEALQAALWDWQAPPGEGYVWIAAEARTARDLRRYMIERRGHPAEWLKAAGYWVRGEAGATKKFQD
jgi:NADPH-dependent ferric siderophore reductase